MPELVDIFAEGLKEYKEEKDNIELLEIKSETD